MVCASLRARPNDDTAEVVARPYQRRGIVGYGLRVTATRPAGRTGAHL